MVAITNTGTDLLKVLPETNSLGLMEVAKPKETFFKENYFLDDVIGEGGFSVVKKCRHKKTEKEFAAKIINSKKLNKMEIMELEKEVLICKKLEHCNIVQLYDFYPESTFFYLILEFVTGGELFDDIVERERYSEADASDCIQQVLEALAYCHSKNIIHRDIKPENLLLASKRSDAKVKLTDFGLAVETDGSPKWYGLAGTPSYLAPEVLRRDPYSSEVDCWACGCILYLLLVGYPPFWNSDQQILYESIKEGAYDFESSMWHTVSFDAKSLIRLLLIVNVKRRASASSALKSQWISQRERVASKTHRQNTVEHLKKFNARRKFKGAIRTTAAAQALGRRFSAMPVLNCS